MRKSKGVAYLLWLFLGLIGGHRFYLGHVGIGIAQLLTAGGLGIWWIIDAFNLSRYVDIYNRRFIRYYGGVNVNNNKNVNNNVNNNSVTINLDKKQIANEIKKSIDN